MCTLERKISHNTTAVGYKVVRVVDGECYSPFTGLRYRNGKVPVMREHGKMSLHEKLGTANVLDPRDFCNKYNYDGRTAVFVKREGAERLADNFRGRLRDDDEVRGQIRVAKMTLGGEVWEASYDDKNARVGNRIRKIEILPPLSK